MKIFIELPTWLGDAVMSTLAIENITLNFPNAKITFFGSFASTSLFTNHPNLEKIIIDDSKKTKCRLFNLAKTFVNLPKFDIAISFRSHFATKFGFLFLKANKKIIFNKNIKATHQAKKYEKFINDFLEIKAKNDELKLYFKPNVFKKPTLGLNPGASYGSAKRWYPEYFAEVGIALKDKYDIIIFGGKNEEKICDEISNILSKNKINHKNLCTKTSIKELCQNIAGLSLFITNDSGPMHIAASYKVPTIAFFGPTKFNETSPYKNQKAKILHLNLDCMPCMKRECPLKTHECMKNLTPKMVIECIDKNFNFS
ncbi:lipopolysaccharide heptosyltransferase II [Campylobacter ureolyticus]|uniref:lipopolysaccharide heptosyltransferase II n=1 Tax=Campylobacter ureolyticus TaxID=827 RepID=A0A9Q4KP78_9BACT|nr:lipopolysaccharide heptosyltransferase II [Campylobacter ureolyticus]MCZ6103058.1 lipopolysaccharide heptosyltransferase II [Campylobacter ureolyticus]MCZ6134180.1 lipopolysaccharide heptosyltransferase II [Campylobacter ureolyticus]MCZ6161226.1 lipopolysaccharide heptosyltransferase II [Campylobacter ureolyticus]MCZ6170490.1 lipopolysaccharide heptosyltransferase II [Campylobacter ureolyticus]MDU4981006.1 lipopolysaccharide heptosyltransferase II [Campylobacter ureolyticus]